MHRPRLFYALCAGALLLLACLGAAPAARAQAVPAVAAKAVTAKPADAKVTAPPGTQDPLYGSFSVGFLLCDPKGWGYHPEPVSYYQDMWTKQGGSGSFKSLADYFNDESYGQMTMAGSKVLGWYPMSMTPSDYGQSQLEDRWQSCVDAALAAGVDITRFKSLVTVQPGVVAEVTGDGIPAWTSAADWPSGQAHPNPESFTVDTTANWPPAPFCLNLTSIGRYGQASWVTKVNGDSVTVIRGLCGSQDAQSTLVAVPPSAQVASITSDDQAYVGPQTEYLTPGGQTCASGHGSCPIVTFGSGTTRLSIGIAGLGAGPVTKDGTTANGVGDAAHEVGHTTGYYHSRALATSQTDYRDCYDQMSYNACGLPDLPTLSGTPDTVVGYDAPDLEYHGWIPASKQFNAANATVKQSTITLHALSDPNALHDSGYLDAHLPAKVLIEDTTPGNVQPTVPPSNCSTAGYQCEHSSYYTAEYRQRYGFDQELTARSSGGSGSLSTGAVILHLVVPHPNNCPAGNCNISYLVDSQPGVSSGNGQPTYLPNGAAFQPGMDYADPAHHVYVAVNSFDAASRSARITVSSSLILPALTVNGPAQAEAGTAATLSATLTAGHAPVPDQTVTLAQTSGPSCTATTSLSGEASCKVTLSSAAGIDRITATFGGDRAYHSALGYGQVQAWAPDAAVSAPPSAGSTTAPAVTWLGTQWFAAWRDASSGDIYWSVDSGSGWAAPVALVVDGKTITTGHAPAVTADGAIPVIAWTAANGDIEYSGFALIAWSGPTTVAGSWGTANTSHGPSFAAMGSHGFIAAWTGTNSKHVYYAEYSNGAWQPQLYLGATTTDYAPAVMAATGDISLAYLAWTNGNGSVGMERLQGSARTALPDVPEAKTHNGPALAATPGIGAYVVAWDGFSSEHVYYREWVDGTWLQQRDEPQALTTQAPAIAFDSPEMQMLWTAPATRVVEGALTSFSTIET